jgi:hypothetical protein
MEKTEAQGRHTQMAFRDRPCRDYTRHAVTRVQQRGIRPEVLEYLLDYGHEEHDHRGGIVVTFVGRSLSSTEKGERERARVQAHDSRRLYAVIDIDGRVITTGHRTQRVKRDRSLRTQRSTGLMWAGDVQPVWTRTQPLAH